MRFPRQARVFRGQLDVAPVAAVVFLLLMFLELGTLTYTPGVLVHLDRGNSAVAIRVAVDGSFRLGTNSFAESETNSLRDALQAWPGLPQFNIELDRGVSASTAARARGELEAIFAIHPPTGPANLLGTDNPTVMVKVNFRGQYFYENRMISERELQEELSRRLNETARESKELTVTVVGDAQVDFSAITRLAALARETGIKDVLLAEWPQRPPPPSIVPSP